MKVVVADLYYILLLESRFPHTRYVSAAKVYVEGEREKGEKEARLYVLLACDMKATEWVGIARLANNSSNVADWR